MPSLTASAYSRRQESPKYSLLRIAALTLIATTSFLSAAEMIHAKAPTKPPAPNIVLIMADDMGFSDIGCYGSEIDTPNLDGLAKRGLRFTQFYNTARCCPTRAALMTGLYPHQAGVGHMMGDYGHPGYRGDLNEQCITIAQALSAAGYQTMMSGKWHVTRQVGHWTGDDKLTSRHNWPRQRGFDRFFGTIHGAGSFYDPSSLTRDNTPIKPEGEDFYYTDAISTEASQYIAAADKDRPFFLYVAYTAPHWPLHAPEETVKKYADRYTAGWDALRAERLAKQRELGIVAQDTTLTPRDRGVPAWENAKHPEWEARRMAVYAAQIDRMDQGIGQIMTALRTAGAADNTLVLFLADNGGCAESLSNRWRGLHMPYKTRDGRPVVIGNDPKIMPGAETNYQSYGPPWANASNTPFRLYKHWVHEGGIATPLVAHWPAGIAPAAHGSLTDQPGHLVDIMATCLDVAGAKYPAKHADHQLAPLDGHTLLPILQGKEREQPVLYWEHEGNRAVRDGDWKLVSRYPGAWELYDLAKDRTELNNLAAAQPEKVAELARLYDQWAATHQVLPWKEATGRK